MAGVSADMAGLNGIDRDTLNSLANQVSLQQSRITGIEVTLSKLETSVQTGLSQTLQQFQAFRDEVLRSKAPNFNLILSGIAFLFVFGGICAGLILLQTRNVISPIESDLKSLAQNVASISDAVKGMAPEVARNSAEGARSSQDRTDLRRDLEQAREMIAENSANFRELKASVESSLVEIETQFSAVEQISNLRWAEHQRLSGLLWKKAYPGEELPMSPWFSPGIARGR
jgi:hypothetical protein